MALDPEQYRTKPRASNVFGSLNSKFEELASGQKGQPHNGAFSLNDDFGFDVYVCLFLRLFVKNMTPFTRHIAATIPFNVDNDCRFGTTVCLYGQALGRKLTYHSLASADGCMARTISEFSRGNIITLTNSPTISNKLEFYKNCPEGAYFWHGPFSEISLKSLREKEDLKPFHSGFDIIFEDLGFQMYDSNRYDQIEFVKRNLKPGGIMLLYEKLFQSDEYVYEQREQQKDNAQYGFQGSGAEAGLKGL